MKRVLITAFEPYDVWKSNASWMTLVELTRDLPTTPKITTRLYPVDYAAMRQRLAADLAAQYDVALHLGQAPGSASIHLEAVALNLQSEPGVLPDSASVLEPGAPVAYQTTLPVARWAEQIRELGIPARVSHHAGTYLCNAVYFLSLHHAAQNGRTRAAFMHLPLDPLQCAGQTREQPTLAAAQSARALRAILQDLDRE